MIYHTYTPIPNLYVQPPKPGMEIIQKWIVDNLILFVYIFVALISAVLTAIITKNKAGEAGLQRAAATILGIVIVTPLINYIRTNYDFDPSLLTALSVVLGIGAHKVAHWTMDFWEKSQGFVQAAGKIGRIINAARGIINEEDKKPPVP